MTFSPALSSNQNGNHSLKYSLVLSFQYGAVRQSQSLTAGTRRRSFRELHGTETQPRGNANADVLSAGQRPQQLLVYPVECPGALASFAMRSCRPQVRRRSL